LLSPRQRTQMPFVSDRQRRFMWARHPDIARRWTDKYGSGVGGSTPTGKHRSVLKKLRRNKRA